MFITGILLSTASIASNPASGIIPKLISLIFAGTILLVLFTKIKILKKYGVTSIIYVLLISILISLPTLINLFDLEINNILLFVFIQVFILVTGIVHVSFIPITLPWYKSQQFNVQIVFVLCILLLAFFFSNLSLSFQHIQSLKLVWYLSLLWFIIPVLLNQTIEELLKVPPKVFKQWFYPVGQNIDDPSDEELENLIVISFVFPKNLNSAEMTTFRAKAPVGMKLGRLFYFFINDYNSRHPEGPISFLKNDREPSGWTFMKVKNKLFGLREAVDPDTSIYVNEIKENDILICIRNIDNQ